MHREFYYNDAGVQIQTLANSTQLRAKGFKPGDAEWPQAAYNGDYIQDIADDFLAKHAYFAGAEFTTADIMMVFPISYAIRMNVADPAKYPNIAAWQKKVEDRPAFKRMLAVARPDGRVAPPPSLVLP